MTCVKSSKSRWSMDCERIVLGCRRRSRKPSKFIRLISSCKRGIHNWRKSWTKFNRILLQLLTQGRSKSLRWSWNRHMRRFSKLKHSLRNSLNNLKKINKSNLKLKTWKSKLYKSSMMSKLKIWNQCTC